MGVLSLALWLLRLSVPWLVVALAATAVWIAGGRGRSTWWGTGGGAALGVAVLIAFGVQYRLHEVARNWNEVRAAVEEDAAAAIGTSLDDLVDRGEQAVAGVSEVAGTLAGEAADAAAFARLERLRRQTGMSALAIYALDANPIAWAGEHRGMIPEPVYRGEQEYAFYRGPLFSYLYFAHPLPGGRTAVAAVLLDSSVPVSSSQAPFADRFAAGQGIHPRFMSPERAQGEAVWDWTTDRPILSVSFARLSQDDWYGRAAMRGRWAVGAAWLAAVLFLAFGWYRRNVGPPGVPIAVVAVSLFLLPFGTWLDAQGLFSPLHFVLALPGDIQVGSLRLRMGDITLGQVLIVTGGLALWLLVRSPSVSRPRTPLWARIGLVAVLVPALVELVRRSASLGLLSTRPAGGFALVIATTLLIALPLYLLLPRPASSGPRRSPAALLAAGILLVAALGLAMVLAWHPERSVPVQAFVLWAVPFALMCVGLSRASVRWPTLTAWLLAGWLGGTAAASALWISHLDARIDAAETELSHLGTEADPYLDYLLRHFAEQAFSLAAEGEDGVNLLYRSWVNSGLAREGYEARLTLWRGEQPEAELRFSDLQLPETMVDSMLVRSRAAEDLLLERYTSREGLHYLLLLPLADDRIVSVATPPRRRLGRATALARFLHPEIDSPVGIEEEALTLVPVSLSPSGTESTASPHRVEWQATRMGWRSETVVFFPAGPMHAHLQVVVPSTWVLVVRGVLVLILVVGSFALLWALARTLCGEPFGFSTARWHGIRTFRGRLTLALFGFFLLPTLALGAVAYGALSQQVFRTGAALSLRSLELAGPEVMMQPLDQLGTRVRADLLLYRSGGLVGASAPEVIDLGLFQSWLPPAVELAFSTGEELQSLEERTVAGNRYLVAYRRIGDDGVLAAPVPLASGEIARMQREFTHGFLLMMLLGAGLSVILSLLVGRALSRPIELLSRATAAVGAGNLRLRLPEDRPDEFGPVYRAFNRMVRRLRRARADEVRTARVLAWGEMARQVAHEIKNPLTPIKLSVQHLRRAFGDRRPDFEQILDRNVEAILREIDRLSQIARAFARFGAPREEVGTLEPVELDRVVDETLVLYRGGKGGADFETRVGPEVPRVLARDGELREVLLNLLENAREAVDGDGRIRIAAEPLGGGEWVRLDVSDNGVGIAPELLPRIFEPQFSTRSSGTGLGLAIVRRLVESWGGQISASSTPGQGTTIHLRLRAASRAIAAPDSTAA
jgi:signal transduction histidine kinase